VRASWMITASIIDYKPGHNRKAITSGEHILLVTSQLLWGRILRLWWWEHFKTGAGQQVDGLSFLCQRRKSLKQRMQMRSPYLIRAGPSESAPVVTAGRSSEGWLPEAGSVAADKHRAWTPDVWRSRSHVTRGRISDWSFAASCIVANDRLLLGRLFDQLKGWGAEATPSFAHLRDSSILCRRKEHFLYPWRQVRWATRIDTLKEVTFTDNAWCAGGLFASATLSWLDAAPSFCTVRCYHADLRVFREALASDRLELILGRAPQKAKGAVA